MTRHDFLNRLRSLSHIDRHMLPELGQGDWYAFRGNPVNYFLHADDTQAAAIWREVEKRQAKVTVPQEKPLWMRPGA